MLGWKLKGGMWWRFPLIEPPSPQTPLMIIIFSHAPASMQHLCKCTAHSFQQISVGLRHLCLWSDWQAAPLVIHPLVVRDAIQKIVLVGQSDLNSKCHKVQLFGLDERIRWAGATHEAEPWVERLLKKHESTLKGTGHVRAGHLQWSTNQTTDPPCFPLLYMQSVRSVMMMT